jgi:alpha/beta superfamily hydrolase
MEKEIKIKTKDKHLIYGTLNTIDGKRSNKLIILVHGLTGHRNSHVLHNAAKYFLKRGYNTFRYDHYSDEIGGRKLSAMRLFSESEDLNEIIKYFNEYKLFLIGHSLGGPIIINADNKKTKAIVLWEPSLNVFKNFKKYVRYEPKIKKYIIIGRTEVIMSKEYFEDIRTITENMIKNISAPVRIIFAGKGILQKNWKPHLNKIKIDHDYKIIKNADHSFNQLDVGEKLLEYTYEWIKRHS